MAHFSIAASCAEALTYGM